MVQGVQVATQQVNLSEQLNMLRQTETFESQVNVTWSNVSSCTSCPDRVSIRLLSLCHQVVTIICTCRVGTLSPVQLGHVPQPMTELFDSFVFRQTESSILINEPVPYQ